MCAWGISELAGLAAIEFALGLPNWALYGLQVASKTHLNAVQVPSKRNLDPTWPLKPASKPNLCSTWLSELVSKRKLGSTWLFRLTSKTFKNLQKCSKVVQIRGSGVLAVHMLLDCCFVSLGRNLKPNLALLGPNLAPLGPNLARLGPNLPSLGRHLGSLGRLLDPTWSLLGRSWALLGGSWDASGRSWTALGDLGSILEPPRVDFGPCRGRFGALYTRLYSSP